MWGELSALSGARRGGCVHAAGLVAGETWGFVCGRDNPRTGDVGAVDGANAIQKFFAVTLPNMRYPLMYTLVTTVVAQFNIYGQPDILVGFNNQEANAVLLMYVYINAVTKQVAGMSSAMALILGVCIMVISFIQIRMMVRNQE